ncbi:MAG: hypothetical protein ACJAXX_002735 [Roseivirga sp.]|jgi:hypothetical protein
MSDYQNILQKLQVASTDENNLHCIKVLDQLGLLFETMGSKQIPVTRFKIIITRLEEILSKDTLYVKQLSVVKPDITEVLRKEYGLTTKLYYRFKWIYNGGLFVGMPLGMIAGVIYGFESIFNWITPIGIVFGHFLGFLIGRAKDRKSAKNGNQLAVI